MGPCECAGTTTWKRDSFYTRNPYSMEDISTTYIYPDQYDYDTEFTYNYSNTIELMEQEVINWRKLELEEWMRYGWNFIRYKMFKAYILPNVKILIRRMNLSYSGWLARSGYKKKKGK